MEASFLASPPMLQPTALSEIVLLGYRGSLGAVFVVYVIQLSPFAAIFRQQVKTFFFAFPPIISIS